MSLYDTSTLFTQRLAANAPWMATLGYTTSYNWALSLLSSYEDGQYLLLQNLPNISVTLATGAALDLLGSSANVFRNPGSFATLLVQFSVPTPVVGTALVIPNGTVVSTYGDNITTIAVYFSTIGTATISVGATTSTLVLALAQLPGSNANVAPGSVVVMNQAISGVSVTNNPAGYPLPTSSITPDQYGQILGTDPDTDASYRQRILAALTSKYASAAITGAIQAVSLNEQLSDLNDVAPHPYFPRAVYVYDPGVTASPSASGAIYYFWALADGSTPGLSGGTQVTSGDQTWTLTVPAGNTSGETFSLTYGGNTASVTFSTTMSTFQTNLQAALTTLFGANNVVAALPTGSGPWTAGFTAAAGLANMALSNFGITNGTMTTVPTIAITTLGGFDGVDYVSSPVLSDFALLVDNAVRAVTPANIIPRIGAVGGVNEPFNVVHVTTMSAKIEWPPSTQINSVTFLDPSSTIVRQAMQQYIQSLVYNQVPTVYGASSFVTSYCAQQNVSLLSFILTGINGTNIITSPLTPGSATTPSLYVSTYTDITPTQIATNTEVVLSQGYL